MDKNYLAVLGRQPELSIAELEVVYGSENIEPFDGGCLLSVKPDVNRLGGTPKTAEIIGKLPKNSSVGLEKAIFDSLMPRLTGVKKINFGLSCYIENYLSAKQLKNMAIALKKHLSTVGVRARFVPNKQLTLNSGQVWHNKLDKEPNAEIILILKGSGIFIAKTIGVQNIDSYTVRDRQKPVRDAKVGMLPPKLAKLMINLADPKGKILDPFCGTGTILMEAILMDFPVTGSDISMRMVEASQKNLAWLKSKYRVEVDSSVYEADAQEKKWPSDIATVVSESYLGPPVSKFPSDIDQIIGSVDISLRSVLRNFHRQDFSKNHICLAVPAWYDQKSNSYRQLPLVDELDSLEYNLVSLEHADSQRLIYRRPDQIVARQILILKRI